MEASSPTPAPAPASVLSPESAKRVQARVDTPSPAAASRDMTRSELTHAYQHLGAQASLDKGWMKKVEEAITDHATRLEQIFAHFRSLDDNLKDKVDNQTVDEKLKDLKTSADPAGMSDRELRDHVQAHDQQVADRMASIESVLTASIANMDNELRMHTQQAIKETTGIVTDIAERLHMMETARGLTTSHSSPASPSTAASPPTGGNRFEMSSLKMRVADLESRMQEADVSRQNCDSDIKKLDSHFGQTLIDPHRTLTACTNNLSELRAEALTQQESLVALEILTKQFGITITTIQTAMGSTGKSDPSARTTPGSAMQIWVVQLRLLHLTIWVVRLLVV